MNILSVLRNLLPVGAAALLCCAPPKTNERIASLDQAADEAQAALDSLWIDGDDYYIDVKVNPDDPDFHYWRNAHAADVLIDGYLRTTDPAYLDRLSKLHAGMYRMNGNTYSNVYYDDMEWVGLAFLRAYDVTGEAKYRATVDSVWTDIKTAWNDNCGGGMAWRKDRLDYKNTPANMPAAILAARLYTRFGNADDLAWAQKIFDWQTAHLVDTVNGMVYDGMNRLGDGKIDTGWIFTYCQGVYIGAAVELYRITNEQHYLDLAIRTADFITAPNSPFNAEGYLKGEGIGDGGLFRGIMIRYLGELIDVPSLPEEKRKLYLDYISHNADVLLAAYPEGKRIGQSWGLPLSTDNPSSLGTQLSAIMLLETASRTAKAY